MKIASLQSTSETAFANGLPVRMWAGKTDRGTSVLALITRIALPDDAPPDEIAEFERELTEGPTRTVDPSGSRIASPRTCTICNATGKPGRRAAFIASNAEGLQWWECDGHGPNDHAVTFSDTPNDPDLQRAARESLEAWFERHDLPVPGAGVVDERGVYRGPASEREPWRSILKRHGAPETLREAVLAAAQRFLDSWEDQDAIPDPDELPAERALYDAALALRAFEVDEKLAAEGGDVDSATLAGWSRQLDEGARLSIDDGDVHNVVHDAIATADPAYPIPVARAAVGGLRPALAPIDDETHAHRCDPSPRLAEAVVRALLEHPQLADPSSDAARDFAAFAWRGVQMGWHARHVHPKDIANIARIAAPLDEPRRAAWLDGYRIAVETIVVPLTLTDALRNYHDHDLVYRAREALTAREREIIAAVAAERESTVAL
jgi:hypothetical protein